ncbi:cystatin-A [Oryzias melastigma]|uniref:cystatin-A n=1 Tax=Oryzias melastigma TaxID=30732 RepID=UPI000CF7BFB3|nr:cystatin-A [Oryzias melastigma]
MFGGLSKTLDANEEIQKIVEQVKDGVDKMADKCFLNLQAIQYRYQSEKGTLYYIKAYAPVKEGDDNYVHLKIFQKPSDKPGNLELLAIQDNHKRPDPIEPF